MQLFCTEILEKLSCGGKCQSIIVAGGGGGGSRDESYSFDPYISGDFED